MIQGNLIQTSKDDLGTSFISWVFQYFHGMHKIVKENH